MVQTHEGRRRVKLPSDIFPLPAVGAAAVWGAEASEGGGGASRQQLAFHSARTLFGPQKINMGFPPCNRHNAAQGSTVANTHTHAKIYFPATASRRSGDWKVATCWEVYSRSGYKLQRDLETTAVKKLQEGAEGVWLKE